MCSKPVVDHLQSNTSGLISLSLTDNTTQPVSIPTASKLLSLLASNPYLRRISLHLAFNNDLGSSCGFQVSVNHLKWLSMTMDFYSILAIVQRLQLPGRVELEMNFRGCTLVDIEQAIGPYIRDHSRGCTGPQVNLMIFAHTNSHRIRLRIKVTSQEYLSESPSSTSTFRISLPRNVSRKERESLCIDILVLLPLERVIFLGTDLGGCDRRTSHRLAQYQWIKPHRLGGLGPVPPPRPGRTRYGQETHSVSDMARVEVRGGGGQ